MLFSYQGHPVERRYRRPGGYTLVMMARQPGRRGRRRFVTNNQWIRHSRLRAAGRSIGDAPTMSPTFDCLKPTDDEK